MSGRTPEIIRNLREDHEYKQETIAKYLGVVQQTYSNYEKGHTSLPLDYLVKLTKFSGFSARINNLPKAFFRNGKNLCPRQNLRRSRFCARNALRR